jgi:uncharacterized protein YehS (DUF1456 family)
MFIKKLNNQVFKKIRVALQLKDQEIIKIFKLRGVDVTRSYLKFVGLGEDNLEYRDLSDANLLAFLDGLIIYKRGLKE